MTAAHPRERVAVAVSGGGRSLANFLAVQNQGHAYEIAGVIASRPDCYAVEIARQHQLPLFVGDFSRAGLAATGERLYTWLNEQRVGLIALAGFLKLFPLDPAWQDRIVNIHPALLPRHGGHGMYGDRVHASVLAAGDRETGATVHFVNERYDEGALIAQIVVPVLPGDTAHKLADRVFAAECRLYPRALDRLIRRELPLPGGQVERLSHDDP